VVDIESAPSGAEVSTTDGILIGTTPLQLLRTELPRRVVLRRLGFRERTVTVRANAAATVHVELQPDPSALRRRAPVTSTPRPMRAWSREGVVTCRSWESGPCAVDAGVIGMAEAELLRRVGAPHRREGSRWHYGWGSTCGFPTVGLELELREGRVTGARAYHNSPDIIDCVGQ
jgi:hypothetical protein